MKLNDDYYWPAINYNYGNAAGPMINSDTAMSPSNVTLSSFTSVD